MDHYYQRLGCFDSLQTSNAENLNFKGIILCSRLELSQFEQFNETKLARSFSKQVIKLEGYKEGPDIRNLLQPVRNQGGSPLCVAFAIASVVEYFVKLHTGFNLVFSPQFIWDHRENKQCEAIKVHNALCIVQKFGICLESMHLFGCNSEPTLRATVQAHEFRINKFYLVESVNEVKLALRSGCVPIIVLPVYNTTTTFWKQRSGEYHLGNHCLMIAGFTAFGFIFRSSFGLQWGIKGYTLDFKFDDWAKYKIECWAIEPLSMYKTPYDLLQPRKKQNKKCVIS